MAQAENIIARVEHGGDENSDDELQSYSAHVWSPFDGERLAWFA
jgi:hypothetical protein